MRNSFSTSSAPSPGSDQVAPTSSIHSNADVQTTVATMRWAAARVDISPLALPSPEHELTDPMRGVTATVPGSYPTEVSQPDHPLTPGAIRKSRSFWHGTTDVETDSSKSRVSSARLGPEGDVLLSKDGSDRQLYNSPSVSISSKRPSLHSHIATPPATSSPDLGGVSAAADYFGLAQSEPHDGSAGTMSAPTLPRRVHLTRQSSSPFPVLTSREPIMSGGRVPDSGRAGRVTKEEQIYAELGYLVPPNPPDEIERRRALYKCDP